MEGCSKSNHYEEKCIDKGYYRQCIIYNSQFKTCEGALEGKVLDLFIVFSFDPGEIIVINGVVQRKF